MWGTFKSTHTSYDMKPQVCLICLHFGYIFSLGIPCDCYSKSMVQTPRSMSFPNECITLRTAFYWKQCSNKTADSVCCGLSIVMGPLIPGKRSCCCIFFKGNYSMLEAPRTKCTSFVLRRRSKSQRWISQNLDIKLAICMNLGQVINDLNVCIYFWISTLILCL